MIDGSTMELIDAVASLDGSRIIRATARANPADAAELGFRVGHELIAKGASEILAEVRAQ
jgi:porphobilinogen deaminase